MSVLERHLDRQIQRHLPPGDKVLRSAEEHPIGLGVRGLRRLLWLAALLVVRGLTDSRWSEALLQSALVTDLKIGGALSSALSWVGTFCGLAALLVLVLAAWDVLDWKLTRFVLTEQRVLQFFGVLTRVVIDTPLDRLDSVIMRQTWLGQQLDYGDLFPWTAADRQQIPLRRLAGPLRFKHRLELQRTARLGQGSGGSSAATAAQRRPAGPA